MTARSLLMERIRKGMTRIAPGRWRHSRHRIVPGRCPASPLCRSTAAWDVDSPWDGVWTNEFLSLHLI